MLVEWNKRFTVDVPKFDSQHLRLFFMINSLHEAMEKRLGEAVLRNTLDELIEYTKTHFQEEEQAMADCRFPGLAAHQQEHRKLQKEVDIFYADMKSGKAVFSGTVLSFLVNWLTNHIAQSDKKYSSYLKSHGVPPALKSITFPKKF